MKVIELLGPSGVGKTFLYNKLFECCTDRKYMNVEEACIQAARDLKLGFEFSWHYLYYSVFRTGLFAFKARGLSRRLLFGNEDLFKVTDQYRLSVQLLKKYLSVEKNLDVSCKRIENFMRCTRLDRVLEKQLGKDQTVFFDEGMLHHHHGLDASLSTRYSAAAIANDRMLNPSAVISCELPFDQLLSRIRQRRASGVQTFSHKGLSEQELKAYVYRTVSEYQYKIDALVGLGIPVLTIHTDESISNNLNAVHSFINNLISS